MNSSAFVLSLSLWTASTGRPSGNVTSERNTNPPETRPSADGTRKSAQLPIPDEHAPSA